MMDILNLSEQLCGDKTVPLAAVLAALAPHYGTKNESVDQLLTEIWENINGYFDRSKEDK